MAEITRGDASACLPRGIANIRKVYPYVPRELNDIFMRYSKDAEKTLRHYKSVSQLLADLRAVYKGGFK